MTRDKVFYAIGLIFLLLVTVDGIWLVWTGVGNQAAWRSLGTVTVLLSAFVIGIAIHRWFFPQFGALTHGTSAPAPEQLTQVTTNGGNRGGDTSTQVTYVFDRDLVRFLKFAGSVLAIFLVTGAFFFGFDLQKMLEVAHKNRDDIQKALIDTQNVLFDAGKIELSIRSGATEIDKTRESVKRANEDIKTLNQETHTFVSTSKKEFEEHTKAAKEEVAKLIGIRESFSFLAVQGSAPLKAAELRPRQIDKIVETKLLKSLRNVLPNDQYAKLEKEIKSAAEKKPRRLIYDAENREVLPGKLVRSEGQPVSDDPLVSVVYDNVGTVLDFWDSVFDRNSLDDHGMDILVTLHYGKGSNNAFWNGTQLAIGHGDGLIFKANGFAALPIMAAELSHGVIQYSCNLEYTDQPGALHSHFTDVFAILTEQWHKKQTVDEASWLIGANLLAPGIKGIALRSLKAPGTAYDDPQLGKDPQPDHMSKYVQTRDDNGGVHINSGIPNRAFYETAKIIGGHAWEKAGKIWYEALLRLTAQSNFQDCARQTQAVAGELYGLGSPEQEAVRKGWEKVGIAVGIGK